MAILRRELNFTALNYLRNRSESRKRGSDDDLNDAAHFGAAGARYRLPIPGIRVGSPFIFQLPTTSGGTHERSSKCFNAREFSAFEKFESRSATRR